MRTVSQKLTTTKFSELRRLFPSKTLLITMAAALALQVNKSMAGCYCMMESKAIAAAYNKSGFWEICHTSTNEIVQVFLHSESISKSNYNIDSHDNTTSYSWSFHWHDTSKMIGDVDINGIENTVNGQGCASLSLPQTSTWHWEDEGKINSDCYSLNWKTEKNDGNNCSGTWHEIDCNNNADDGDACEFEPPYYWLMYSLGSNKQYKNYIVITNVCSESFLKYEYKYDYSVSDQDSSYQEHDGDEGVTILSNPFTDAMLRKKIISRLPPWPDWSGGGASAYYDLSGNHVCGGGGKIFYRVKVPDSDKDTEYLVAWKEITTYPNSTNTIEANLSEWVKGTGDPENPAIGKVHFIDMPGFPCTISPTAPGVADTRPTGGGGGPGGGIKNIPGVGGVSESPSERGAD